MSKTTNYLIAYVSEGMNAEEDTKYLASADSPASAYRKVFDYINKEDPDGYYAEGDKFADFIDAYAVLMWFEGKYLDSDPGFKVQEV